MRAAVFHLAFVVDDLEESRKFYTDILGCEIGRECERWIDFSFFGHQLTAHLGDKSEPIRSPVDRKSIPVPHFGVVLDWHDFALLRSRLERLDVVFEVEPYVRFAGAPGEQATMFISDPCGNFLEFKSFRDSSLLFARE